jgi:hypothetical protein
VSWIVIEFAIETGDAIIRAVATVNINRSTIIFFNMLRLSATVIERVVIVAVKIA